MTQERLILEGRLAEKQREAAEMKLKIEAERDQVRMLLDKYLPVGKAEFAKGAMLLTDCVRLQRKYLDAREDIEALKLDLGIRDD